MKVLNSRKRFLVWGLAWFFVSKIIFRFLFRLLSSNCPFTHERRSQILKEQLTRLYPAVFFRFVVTWSWFCVGRLVGEQVQIRANLSLKIKNAVLASSFAKQLACFSWLESRTENEEWQRRVGTLAFFFPNCCFSRFSPANWTPGKS